MHRTTLTSFSWGSLGCVQGILKCLREPFWYRNNNCYVSWSGMSTQIIFLLPILSVFLPENQQCSIFYCFKGFRWEWKKMCRILLLLCNVSADNKAKIKVLNNLKETQHLKYLLAQVITHINTSNRHFVVPEGNEIFRK